MQCPDDNVLTEFVDGTLPVVEAAAIEGHIDTCASCRALLADFARAHEPEPSSEDAAPTPQAAYMNGRYVPQRVLGVGGMSVVYEGLDTALQRRVALKVMLHAPEDVRARLRREAQALGMLSHPNVVGVFDVEISGAGAFLACEFVEGGSLRTWLAEADRSFSDIVAITIDAARGLEAAHRVGLLHRDVTPNNILVGQDGRARVADFGLARLPDALGRATAPESEPSQSDDAPSELPEARRSDPFTGVMGTPGYMAPEVRAGAPADIAADQYGLCASAAEAMATLPSTARHHPAARRVARILARGLSEDPAQRFHSISALRRALQRAARPNTTARVAGGIVAIGVLAAWAAQRSSPPHGPCHTVDGSLAARVSVAELDVAPPVVRVIDERARRWEHVRAQTCAPQADPLPERIFDLRWSCLRAARRGLIAFSQGLAGQSERNDQTNLLAAESLPDARSCQEDEALSRGFAIAPPELQTRLADLRERLASLVAARNTGHEQDLGPKFEALLTEATALGYDPLTAEVLRHWAFLEKEQKRIDAAREHYLESAHMAAGAGSDVSATWSWLGLLALEGNDAMDYDAAFKLLPMLDALLVRLDHPDKLEAQRDQTVAVIHDRRAEYEEAEPLYERALLLTERVFGTDSLTYANRLGNVGVHNARWGRLDVAAEQLYRALAIHEDLFGEDAAVLTDKLSNLAGLELSRLDYPKAEALARRTLALRQRDLAPDDPRVALSLSILGQALSFDNRVDEALPYLTQTIEIKVKRLGPKHPSTIDAYYQLAVAHARANHGEQARAALAPAVAAVEDPSVSNEQRGVIYLELGRQHQDARQWPQAVNACQRAVDALSDPPTPDWLKRAQSCLTAAQQERPED